MLILQWIIHSIRPTNLVLSPSLPTRTMCFAYAFLWGLFLSFLHLLRTNSTHLCRIYQIILLTSSLSLISLTYEVNWSRVHKRFDRQGSETENVTCLLLWSTLAKYATRVSYLASLSARSIWRATCTNEPICGPLFGRSSLFTTLWVT